MASSTSRLVPAPVGPEPDEFLYVGVGRHDLPRAIEDRQVFGIGCARHGARHRLKDVNRRITAALGDGASHDSMAVENAAHSPGKSDDLARNILAGRIITRAPSDIACSGPAIPPSARVRRRRDCGFRTVKFVDLFGQRLIAPYRRLQMVTPKLRVLTVYLPGPLIITSSWEYGSSSSPLGRGASH